jgi:AAA-like domain/CHAT domain
MKYRDFDLHIRRSGRRYVAHVVSSDAGEAEEVFTLPFTEVELENLILKLRPSTGNRSLSVNGETAAKDLGGRLYKAVFQGQVALLLASCIDRAQREQAKVRIKLRLTDAPDLASLPWEFLYDESQERFLVLSRETALVRYLEQPRPLAALTVTTPIRVLVMISSPRDCPPLNVEAEWQKLLAAFGELPDGLVELKRLDRSSLIELDQQLSRQNYHIFHYIGHGVFDERAEESYLVLENEDGSSFEIAGDKIGVHLHNHPSLRLVILNACEGARASAQNVYSGLAQGLIRCGIPAVIGMQFEISDQAAIAFSSRFYDAIVRSQPVDAALDEARRAIHAAQNGGMEWGTPVLYLRAPDGKLFDVILPPKPASPSPPATDQVQPPIVLPNTAPSGTLSHKSQFYIERRAETRAVGLIKDPGVTLLIIKSGQSGGSSLMNRLLETAQQAGKRTAYLNFQRRFTGEDMADAEKFHYRFCVVLTNLLGVKDVVETYWERYRNVGLGDRCSYYLQYLLQQLGEQSLLLAMDEIDRLDGSPFKSDFFAMVRNWHNDRAMEPGFDRLDLVLITSLERSQLIDDHFQSPFNVGEDVRIDDFIEDEALRLSQAYGLQLNSEQISRMAALLGGHPYLYQLALHHIAKTGTGVESLIQSARKSDSPFQSHLESLYANVRGTTALLEGVSDVLRKREPAEKIILQLRRAGLVQRRGNIVSFRCRLYEDYFREQFHS